MRVFSKYVTVFNFLILFVCVLFMSRNALAQQRFIDKKGVVVFEASEKLFEEVKAKNESVTALLDPVEQKIAALALMRAFHFKNPLMQEHFNENYIESDLYPKAIFKGQIQGLNLSDIGSETREYVIDGTLEIRGKAKQIQPMARIQKVGNIISLSTSFKVLPGDFDIRIPKIVENKIAREVMIRVDFKLESTHVE